jgi:LysM repeat protein
VLPGTGTPATTPPPAAGTTPSTGTHIIQSDETLGMIGERYGVSVAALAQANALSNPSLIYVGQQLVIPGGGTSSGPATQPPPTVPSGSGSHIVQPGETLFRIGTQYGVDVNSLKVANGLTEDVIFTGQSLIIPTGSGNTPAPAPAPLTPTGPVPSPTLVTGKQIIVVLSRQSVYAFENGKLLNSFVVSTGLPATPTVQGDYAIYLKYDAQRMAGPGYDLPGVPWVMYFYQGYGLHGTYWHNNFGHPMSHGCVNMRTDEALWLYQWAPVGTAVRVIWA